MSHARTVELSWAGRVRTGNKKVFEYAKDYEVIRRFKEILSREGIYKKVIFWFIYMKNFVQFRLNF